MGLGPLGHLIAIALAISSMIYTIKIVDSFMPEEKPLEGDHSISIYLGVVVMLVVGWTALKLLA